MGLVILGGVIVSIFYENAVIKVLKRYLDKHLTTEIEVSGINFSAFKKFPNATVEFRNIVAKSGTNFSPEDFENLSADTLLTAKSVFFEFSLPGVIKGDYKLKNILIYNGKANILIDLNGRGNFNVWESGQSKDQEGLNFSLQNIILVNTSIRYVDMSNNFSIDSDTRRFHVRADFSDINNHLAAKGELNIRRFVIGKSYELFQKHLKVDIKLDYNKTNYKFSESIITTGKSSVLFSGEFIKSKYTAIVLNLLGNNANINDLIDFYPGQLSNLRDDYLLTGLVDFKGNINGTLSKNLNPKFDINFNLKNGSVTNRLNRKKISGLAVNGDFANGSKRNRATSSLNIKEFKARQDKSIFEGALKIKGFDYSDIELIIKSDIRAGNFFEFLNIDTLEQVSGTINTDLFIKGRLTSLKKFKKNEIISLDKEGIINLKDFAFKFTGSNLIYTQTNGSIILGDVVRLRDVSFKVFENDFKIDCNLTNLTEFLFYKDFLYAEGNLRSGFLDIRYFITNSKSENPEKFFEFPVKIYFKSNLIIDNFIYGKFAASNINGYVTYKPRVFDFEQFRLESVEGSITGSARVSQNPDRNVSIECFSKLDNINIQKLFFAVNNFGQDVILGKNLKGKLSGSLDFSTTWDKNLDMIGSSVLASSNFEIRNGELLNYEPMLGLSKYIDVEELKDIKFNTLRNQIFIKDKVITIPEMDIQSTAFNIKGSGIHRFDNSYDYRIQVELSELLARKARKKRKEVDEFGAVHDDGLGRLNIPIKITGKGNIYNAELDKRKAVGDFKKSISQEKEEFKNIFNIEKSGGGDKKMPVSQDNKFIIDWDDGNEKKDFIFEKNDQVKDKKPQFIIEWDDDDGADKKDTTKVRIN